MSAIMRKLTASVFQKPWLLYAAFVLLIIALKWPFIALPPVWDEAFSIFPSADFLVQNNFDYLLLLAQPGYSEGGPTAHALSLLTLLTAFILKITGGGKPAWVILHLLQWLMMAGIGCMLTRIYSTLFEKIPALLLSVATLCYPLMLAQAGYMYIEVPLLFFTVLAFYSYLHNRIWICSLFLIAACAVKESGVIAVGVMFLLVMLESSGAWGRKIKKACIIAIPAITAVLALLVFRDYKSDLSIVQDQPNACRHVILTIIVSNLFIYKSYISQIPEMMIIVVGSILLSIFFLSAHVYQKVKKRSEQFNIIIFNSLFILMFFIFHFILLPVVQQSDSHFLSRYFFYVIPSMFLMLYYPIDRALKKPVIKECILFMLIIVFLINRGGMLYPSIPFSSIAMAERSEEYVNGYQVQEDYIALIEKKIPKNVPVYLSLPDYFLTRYAVSGYVTRPLPNANFIGDVLKNEGNRFRYPDHFVLVYSYPWLGGVIIQRMIEDLSRKKNTFLSKSWSFKKGDFNAYVIEIKMRKGINDKGTN